MRLDSLGRQRRGAPDRFTHLRYIPSQAIEIDAKGMIRDQRGGGFQELVRRNAKAVPLEVRPLPDVKKGRVSDQRAQSGTGRLTRVVLRSAERSDELGADFELGAHAAEVVVGRRRPGFLAPTRLGQGCSVAVTGGINRPPMERTRGTVKLFRLAQRLAAQLDSSLDEASTGGASDGNFTSALGLPTLDGLGPVGQGAHAPHESVSLDSIAPRTALLAALLASRIG